MSEPTVIKGPGVPIMAWTKGVPVDGGALRQLENVANLPFIHHHIAVMPDVHFGMGATVGSVIPCKDAVIPAAVGVDIGCGMVAARTNLTAAQLPEHLLKLRTDIERVIPHGRTNDGRRGDRGAWGRVPERVAQRWSQGGEHSLQEGLARITSKHPKIGKAHHVHHLGTLGSGNHFVELCLDEEKRVWLMLHSGSRGVGNRIGTYFIELAKEEVKRKGISLRDADLAYFERGSPLFHDYLEGAAWAQSYAKANRELMLAAVMGVLRNHFPRVAQEGPLVDCHHNYVAEEEHFGASVLLTRKGAVRAGLGEWGIIPGSMGARSFIVQGKGHPDAFLSCSHGAGRLFSRSAARKQFTLDDHKWATKGVECCKDAKVLDETPGAYKNIDAVMAAQDDLVTIRHTLKQVLCIKG